MIPMGTFLISLCCCSPCGSHAYRPPGLLFDAKDALGFLCKISGQSIAEDFCCLIRIPVNRCYENAFRLKDLFLVAANHLAPDFHCS